MSKNNFTTSDHLEGVIYKQLTCYKDKRGYLMEIFRHDELEEKLWPVMGYISVTNPGITRGPHEHVSQTDIFAFVGPGDFLLALWDARKSSPTYGKRFFVKVGSENPATVTIPEGVVHAYHCISSTPGTVINIPNQLYAGKNKKEPVDEIRHEENENSAFVLDLKEILREQVL